MSIDNRSEVVERDGKVYIRFEIEEGDVLQLIQTINEQIDALMDWRNNTDTPAEDIPVIDEILGSLRRIRLALPETEEVDE